MMNPGNKAAGAPGSAGRPDASAGAITIPLDASLASSQWTLRQAVAPLEAYPLVYLVLESTQGAEAVRSRLDLHKAMLIDPLPEGARLSREQLTKLSQFIARKLQT